MLHPYQKKKIENVPDLRAMAFVIEEIAEFALRGKIPLCFPSSRGSAHQGDFSRIVSFHPHHKVYSPLQESI